MYMQDIYTLYTYLIYECMSIYQERTNMFSTYINWNRVIYVCIYVLYTHSTQPYPYTRPNTCYRNRHVWLHESSDGTVHQLPFPNRNARKTKFHGWTVAKKNSAIPRLKTWTAVRPSGRTELHSPLKPQVSEPWMSAVLTCGWAGFWQLLSA